MPTLRLHHDLRVALRTRRSRRAARAAGGVAFYGRSGSALMKSLKRLSIDPLAVYGTLCAKCPVVDPALAEPARP